MSTTPRLTITELVEGQSGGDVVFNEAIAKLESILVARVLDRDLTAPPGGESDGDLYIVGAGATGAWASHDAEFALYYGGYVFSTPSEGMLIWIEDEESLFLYQDSAWRLMLKWDNANDRVEIGDATITDGADLNLGTGAGTKIGTATAQKIGFWNATPVVQAAHIADPTGGATTDAEARSAINSILVALENAGITASA